MRRATLGALVAAAALLALGSGAPLASSQPLATPQPGPGFEVQSLAHGQEFENLCSDIVAPGFAECLGYVRVDPGTQASAPNSPAAPRPAVAGATPQVLGNAGAYDPSYLQSAYNAPSFSAGSGVTVGIVDAYDDPNAASDLAQYRTMFGLPACTTANGCLTQVNQTGGSTLPIPDPTPSHGWAGETSLDLDMVSALCPLCHIVLVEANSDSVSDLGTAVNEAVSQGAKVIDNSYGGSEYPGEASDATSYYDHPGVALTAASGDTGFGVSFPAAAPDVTAVGGTSLDQLTNSGSRDATETAWSQTGSGCSAYVAKPSWQSDTGCGSRTVVDVAADADPNTGVWVYDSYPSGGWDVYGGTSAASAIIAGIYALAGAPPAGTFPDSFPYADPAGLNDIVSGSNGGCGTYLCNAGVGYDGPTGLGTPNGVAAFTASNRPGAPTNVSAVAGNGQAVVSFTAPSSNGGSAISSYTVTASPGGAHFSGASSPITVAGLTNGTPYTFTVVATNANGTGPASTPSNAVTPATVPGAPTGVSATAGDQQASVSFSAPASNGGAAISSYTVTALPGGTHASGTSSPITVTGLSDGTPYTFTVTATNSAGTGPSSSSSSPVTPQKPSPPGAPTGVTASAGNQQATVSFTAPASDGGGAISSYTVTALPGGAHASGASSPITVTGLTNGTPYTFTVTAANSAGAGPASSPSGPVTPAAPPSGGGGGGGGGGSDAISVSMTPATQSVASGGTATFTVTITNAGGSYLFNVGASDPAAPGCNQATSATPAATLATLESMAPGVNVTYSCTVTVASNLTNTVTATGIGPDAVTVTATASSTVTTSAPAPLSPPAPMVNKVTPSLASHTVTPAVSVASLSLSGLKTNLVGTTLTLHLTAKVSESTVLKLILVDGKGHKLTQWSFHAKKGTNALAFKLPQGARKPGHDQLRITETGSSKPKTLPLLLRA